MYSTGYKLSDKIEVQFCSLFSISKSKSTFQSQTKFSSCRQILFAIPFHPQNVLQNVLRMFYSPIYSPQSISFPMYSTGSFISDKIEVHPLSFSERSHPFLNQNSRANPKSISTHKSFLRSLFPSERSSECSQNVLQIPLFP